MKSNKLCNCVVRTNIRELAQKLNYEYNNIEHLECAMYTKKLKNKLQGKNRKNYTNSATATLGDSILKFVITEKLYLKNMDKGKITDKKSKLESNATQNKVSEFLELSSFAFNDVCASKDAEKHQQLPSSIHELYLEAIIGAVYLDRGMRYTKKWILNIIYPLLEDFSK